MVMTSGAAKVIPGERDLSLRVRAQRGAFAAMALPAPRGPLTPFLVGGPDVLLRKYTPRGTVEVGFDEGFFQALAYLQFSNKLLVNRAQNKARYGGCFVRGPAATKANGSAEFGFLDIGEYDLLTVDGRVALGAVQATVDSVTDTFAVTPELYAQIKTGDTLTIASTEALPNGIIGGTTYYAIKTATANKIKVASTANDATGGTAINLTDPGSGTITVTITSIVAETAAEYKALFFYGADPGSWNNNLRIRVVTDQAVVREPGAFMVEVFNGTTRVEAWTCSRDPNHKNGRNQNIFVETILQGSEYIRAISNPLVDKAVLPKATTSLAGINFAGGHDGEAVTDSTMIAAIKAFEDTDRYKPVIVFDGGWNTVAYQQAIINLCEKRGDCAFILSIPFAELAKADYLNAILKYKHETLISVSNYGALFTPHVEVLDEMNNRRLFIAPSGHVAGKYAYNFEKFDPWQPTAGNTRGLLNVLGLYRNFRDEELDQLYDNNVNPIRFTIGKGIRIWGQKTLQVRASDLDRMNARMLLITIKPPIKDVLDDFLFELNNLENNEGVRGQIKAIIENYMEGVKARNGVYEFKVICDENNNTESDIENNILNVWLLVKITKSIEWIPFTIGVTPYGMDFKLAESLL